MQLLLNIDVPELAPAERFYVDAFGLRPGRRVGGDVLELLGAEVPVYLLQKPQGSTGAGAQPRLYERHWSPLHVDVLVADLAVAHEEVTAAGASYVEERWSPRPGTPRRASHPA